MTLCCTHIGKEQHCTRKKVCQILKFYGWHFGAQATLLLFRHPVSHCAHIGLRGTRRDLHCNPMKVVVSGKALFVPGGRKWDSLRDGVSRGWRGISHSVLFRTDVILSSPSLGCLSWQPKKACAHPTVPTARLGGKFAPFHSRTNGPRFNHVICHWQTTIGRRWGHYHIDESRSCLFHLPDSRKCV